SNVARNTLILACANSSRGSLRACWSSRPCRSLRSLRARTARWTLRPRSALRTLRSSSAGCSLRTGWPCPALLPNGIPREPGPAGWTGRARGNNTNLAVAVADARENLTRSLRNSLTTDEERARSGESACDDVSVGHDYFPLWPGSRPWVAPQYARPAPQVSTK